MFHQGEPRLPRDNWANLFSSPYIHQSKLATITAARENEALLQRMSKLHSLSVHRGCVNTIWWDETGQYLLSGSDDHRLIITEPYSKKIYVDVHTSHRANVFSAKFLPASNIRKIVSCAGDGNILFTDLARLGETHNNNFTCHSGTTYELQTVQNDPNSFLSCGEDGTVRWFDLRTKDKCRKSDCTDDILINFPFAVTSMSMHPLLPYYLAVGSSDSSVRLFDRRMLGSSNPSRCKAGLVSRFLLPEMEGKKRRITAVDYRPDGQEILVSFSSDYIYIFNPEDNDEEKVNKLCVGQRPKGTPAKARVRERSPPPMKRLRLRGDWSDTGPNARPEPAAASSEEGGVVPEEAAAQDPDDIVPQQGGSEERPDHDEDGAGRRGPPVNMNLMQRMTDALSRMLNDPSTRLAMRTLSERESAAAAGRRGQNDAADEVAEANPGNEESNAEISIPVPTAPQTNDPPQPSTSNWGEEIQPTTSNWNEAAAASVTTRLTSNESQTKESNPTVMMTTTNTTTENEDDNSGSRRGSRPENAIDHTIGAIHDSISTMREEFIDRHNVEPGVNLRYSDQGVESSMISIVEHNSNNTDNQDTNNSNEQNNTADVTAEETGGDDNRNDNESSAASTGIRLLPGPRQVLTHPGASGTNPVTGERQRRRGVSGPSSESLAMSTPQPSVNERNDDDDLGGFSDDDCCEYNYIDGSDANGQEDSNSLHRMIKQPRRLQKFSGHRNARTMIKEATWWGNNFVLSGSDCGHIFGWERSTGKLILLLEADRHVVNCIQPHPYDPMIASSGIDYDVKIWVPSGEGNPEPIFDEKRAAELTRMNEIMLEETRDTITVPATLMIRMLASLNQIRRAGRLIPRVLERRREREEQTQEQQESNIPEERVDPEDPPHVPRDDNEHEPDEEGLV